MPEFAYKCVPELDGEMMKNQLAGTLEHWNEKEKFGKIELGGNAVFVKFFAGTKAKKVQHLWEISRILQQKNVPAPRALAAVEMSSRGKLVRAIFVTEFVPAMSDFRVEFSRAIGAKNQLDRAVELLKISANAIRKMHDAGIVHNDLGNQNIGIREQGAGSREQVKSVPAAQKSVPAKRVPTAILFDFDRAKIFPKLTDKQRGNDLARLQMPSALKSEFFKIYRASPTTIAACNRAQFWFQIHEFLRPIRHPFREFRQRKIDHQPFFQGFFEWRKRARKIWIWDERSRQPIVAFESRERCFLRPLTNILRVAKEFLLRGISFWRTFKKLDSQSFSVPVNFKNAFGIALEIERNWPKQLEFLAQLEGDAKIPVILRIYHHLGNAHWQRGIECARELKNRGNAVAIALVQDRAAIENPNSWQKMLEKIIAGTQDFADFYELGHATNRGKWGIWDFADYKKLLVPALALKKAFPQIKFVGPACIDFDAHSLPPLLNFGRIFGKKLGVPANFFSQLSQHLYVDRRGDPENAQNGFDLVKKCVFLRALAKIYRVPAPKIIVSEVNWPLLNTGRWSPVSWYLFRDEGPKRAPSVSEEDCAKFLRKYYLLAIASGHVERVYWWNLAARGFGLVDDSDAENWRARPAFFELQKLIKTYHNAGTVSLSREEISGSDKKQTSNY